MISPNEYRGRVTTVNIKTPWLCETCGVPTGAVGSNYCSQCRPSSDPEEAPLRPGNWRCGKCRKENDPNYMVCSCNSTRPPAPPAPPEPPESFEDAVEEVVGDLMLVMYSKQRDYGRGNIDAFGEVGVLVRASDKLARLKNLLYDNPGSTPKNESVVDTWGDLANYAIIALMIRRGWWGLPLIESGLSPDSMEDKDNE